LICGGFANLAAHVAQVLLHLRRGIADAFTFAGWI
jgi:hypothetical protein